MKKVWIGIFVLVVLAGIGGIYYSRIASNKTQLPEVSTTVPASPTPEELLVWEDQAGFSFSYPKSLVRDSHEEDQENYAHIEFSHPDYPGSITVWAKDTTAKDITTWVKSVREGTMFDTVFADKDAKKVLITTPKKKVLTATIDDSIVFYVEGEFDQSAFWTKTYDTIISTFTFTVDAATTVQEATVDEEEILE